MKNVFISAFLAAGIVILAFVGFTFVSDVSEAVEQQEDYLAEVQSGLPTAQERFASLTRETANALRRGDIEGAAALMEAGTRILEDNRHAFDMYALEECQDHLDTGLSYLESYDYDTAADYLDRCANAID